jgi:hypothetical protein
LYEIRRSRPKNDALAGLDQRAGLRPFWIPKGPPVPIDAVQTIAGASYKPVSSRLQYVFTSQVMCASAQHVHSLLTESDRMETYNLSHSK